MLNKILNLLNKFEKTKFYQRMFYRALNPKGFLNLLSLFLWIIIFLILLTIFFKITSTSNKAEVNLYRTDGVVTEIRQTADRSFLFLKTSNGEILRFIYFRKHDKNITRELKNQEISIYTTDVPKNMYRLHAQKVVDKNGNILVAYKRQIEITNIKTLSILCIVLMILIYFMNCKNTQYKEN